MKNKKGKGFTLIEILLVISITVFLIMSAFTIYNKVSKYQQSEKITYFANTLKAGIKSVFINISYTKNENDDLLMTNGGSSILKSILGDNYKLGSSKTGNMLTFYNVLFQPLGFTSLSDSDSSGRSTSSSEVDFNVYVNSYGLCQVVSQSLFDHGYKVSVGNEDPIISRNSSENEIKRYFTENGTSDYILSSETKSLKRINTSCKKYSASTGIYVITFGFDM